MENKGFVLWMTGLPCSGKTTIAKELMDMLSCKDKKTIHLDGDVVRKSLCSDLGFSKEDRDENLRRITALSSIMADNGINVICTFVSPYRATRQKIRESVPNFVEVFVDCDPRECERRDVKGMYKLAREGKIKDFTGVDDPYEKPENAEITVNTDKQTVRESACQIYYNLEATYGIN